MSHPSKLRSLTADLAGIAATNERICLWLSGGSDSRLLLEAMLKLEKPFGILRFDDGWNRRQKKAVDDLIRFHRLQVFSYPPIFYSMVGEAGNLSLAAFYAIDRTGRSAPLIRDIVSGDDCTFDVQIERAIVSAAPIEFDAHIWGTRQDDRHYIFGDQPLIKNDCWTIGDKNFYAPLAGWTRAEVIENLKKFGVDYVVPDESSDTGNIAACTNCLHDKRAFCPKEEREIEPHDWSAAENTRIFRESFK